MAAGITSAALASSATGTASMRPRPNGRGNLPALAELAVQAVRFNEAAAEWPREYGANPRYQRRDRASMRPRPNGRGNAGRQVQRLRVGGLQ